MNFVVYVGEFPNVLNVYFISYEKTSLRLLSYINLFDIICSSSDCCSVIWVKQIFYLTFFLVFYFYFYF